MKEQAISEACLGRFIHAGHAVASTGLVRCSSGNLSLRTNKEQMLITSTGSWLGRLTIDDVVLCRISDGAAMDERRPSEERHLHAGLMRLRPDVNAVLHFQSPNATALACLDGLCDDFNVIPEIPYHVGPVAVVDYIAPGSEALARAVVTEMASKDLLVMKNHGQVVVGKDLDDVICKALFFELACEILLKAGPLATRLSEADVADLTGRGRKGTP